MTPPLPRTIGVCQSLHFVVHHRSDMYISVGSCMMQFYSQCNKLFCWILKMRRARSWWSSCMIIETCMRMIGHVSRSIDSSWHLKGHTVFFSYTHLSEIKPCRLGFSFYIFRIWSFYFLKDTGSEPSSVLHMQAKAYTLPIFMYCTVCINFRTFSLVQILTYHTWWKQIIFSWSFHLYLE